MWCAVGYDGKPGMNILNSSPEKHTLIIRMNSARLVGGRGRSWIFHSHLVRTTRLTNFKNQAHGH